MAITIEDATEYLESIGVNLPAIIVRSMFGRLSSIDMCLNGAGYDEGTIDLIKLYLMSLFGLFGVDGQISSQTAPNGASQSFRFGSLGDRYRTITASLRSLDPSGCSESLIPKNPENANCGLWVSPGDECE